MLVITRKEGESIQIGSNIIIHISDLNASQVRVAISAPASVAILRSELLDTDALVSLEESVLMRWVSQLNALIRR